MSDSTSQKWIPEARQLFDELREAGIMSGGDNLDDYEIAREIKGVRKDIFRIMKSEEIPYQEAILELRERYGLAKWINLKDLIKLGEKAKNYKDVDINTLVNNPRNRDIKRYEKTTVEDPKKFIENQLPKLRDGIVQLVSNARDAIIDGDFIGGFGEGFFASLGFLEVQNGLIYVDTKAMQDNNKPYKIGLKKDGLEYYYAPFKSSKTTNGTIVSLKKNFTPEEVSKLGKEVIEAIGTIDDVIINLNGERINTNRGYTLSKEKDEIPDGRVVNITLNTKGFSVEDTGKGMDASTISQKLLNPQTNGKSNEPPKDKEKLKEKCRENTYYKTKNKSTPSDKTAVRLCVGGHCITQETTHMKTMGNIGEFVLYLPSFTTLKDARSHIDPYKEVVVSINSVLEDIHQNISNLNEKMEILEIMGSIIETMKGRETTDKDENSEYDLEKSVPEYFKKIKDDIESSGKTVIPYNYKVMTNISTPERDLNLKEYLGGVNNNLVFVSDVFMRLHVANIPGIEKMENVKNNKLPFYEIEFSPNAPHDYLILDEAVIVNSKYTKDPNDIIILNTAINLNTSYEIKEEIVYYGEIIPQEEYEAEKAQQDEGVKQTEEAEKAMTDKIAEIYGEYRDLFNSFTTPIPLMYMINSFLRGLSKIKNQDINHISNPEIAIGLCVIYLGCAKYLPYKNYTNLEKVLLELLHNKDYSTISFALNFLKDNFVVNRDYKNEAEIDYTLKIIKFYKQDPKAIEYFVDRFSRDFDGGKGKKIFELLDGEVNNQGIKDLLTLIDEVGKIPTDIEIKTDGKGKIFGIMRFDDGYMIFKGNNFIEVPEYGKKVDILSYYYPFKLNKNGLGYFFFRIGKKYYSYKNGKIYPIELKDDEVLIKEIYFFEEKLFIEIQLKNRKKRIISISKKDEFNNETEKDETEIDEIEIYHHQDNLYYKKKGKLYDVISDEELKKEDGTSYKEIQYVCSLNDGKDLIIQEKDGYETKTYINHILSNKVLDLSVSDIDEIHINGKNIIFKWRGDYFLGSGELLVTTKNTHGVIIENISDVSNLQISPSGKLVFVIYTQDHRILIYNGGELIDTGINNSKDNYEIKNLSFVGDSLVYTIKDTEATAPNDGYNQLDINIGSSTLEESLEKYREEKDELALWSEHIIGWEGVKLLYNPGILLGHYNDNFFDKTFKKSGEEFASEFIGKGNGDTLNINGKDIKIIKKLGNDQGTIRKFKLEIEGEKFILFFHENENSEVSHIKMYSRINEIFLGSDNILPELLNEKYGINKDLNDIFKKEFTILANLLEAQNNYENTLEGAIPAFRSIEITENGHIFQISNIEITKKYDLLGFKGYIYYSINGEEFVSVCNYYKMTEDFSVDKNFFLVHPEKKYKFEKAKIDTKDSARDSLKKFPSDLVDFANFLKTDGEFLRAEPNKINHKKSKNIKLSQLLEIYNDHRDTFKGFGTLESKLEVDMIDNMLSELPEGIDLKTRKDKIWSKIKSQDKGTMLWLREVVQNSRDAILKSREDGNNVKKEIDIDFYKFDDDTGNWITSIRDHVGMGMSEVFNYLLPLGESGNKPGEGGSGMFGQGFYSMAVGAREIRVKTSKGQGKELIYITLIPNVEKYTNENGDEAERISDFDISYDVVENGENFKGTLIERVDESEKIGANIRALRGVNNMKKYVGNIDDVTLNYNGEKANNEKIIFGEINVPGKGKMTLAKSNDGIEKLTHNNLYISNIPEEYLKEFPDWVIKKLRRDKLSIDLPSDIEMTTSREGIGKADENLPLIKPYIFDLMVKYILSEWAKGNITLEMMPQDFMGDDRNMPKPEFMDLSKKFNKGEITNKDIAGLKDSSDFFWFLCGCNFKGSNGEETSLLKERKKILEKIKSYATEGRAKKSVEEGLQLAKTRAKSHKEYLGYDIDKVAEKSGLPKEDIELFNAKYKKILDFIGKMKIDGNTIGDIDIGYYSDPNGSGIQDGSKNEIRFNVGKKEYFNNLVNGVVKGNKSDLQELIDDLTHEATHTYEQRFLGKTGTHEKDEDHPESFIRIQREILTKLLRGRGEMSLISVG